MGEFNFYDIYIPTLLVQAIIAYVLFRLLSPLIHQLSIRGWIAFPSIFHLCFYLVLLWLIHEIFVATGI